MPAYGQIIPSGSYNNVGADYLTPKTAAGDITVAASTDGSNPYAAFDTSAHSFNVDQLDEYTPGNGLLIDSVKLKDGGVRLKNAAYLTARNAGDTADVNIFRLTTGNELEHAAPIKVNTWDASGITASGAMTVSGVSVACARYWYLGSNLIMCSVNASFTLGGTADYVLSVPLPITSKSGWGQNVGIDAYNTVKILTSAGIASAGSVILINAPAKWALGAGNAISGNFFYEI